MPSGQIFVRKSNTWLLRFYQGQDPATGKRRYLNKTVLGESALAEAELARLLCKSRRVPKRARSWMNTSIGGWL